MKEQKRFTVSMPIAVHSWLKQRASVSSRSMSGEVLEVVKKEKEKEVKGKDK